MITRPSRCAFGLGAALTCGLPVPACAEVHVAGSPAAVRITTSQDTISDVLSAIAATFNVRYRTTFPVDAAADATYSGSLGHVISRLLDGHNYLIKWQQDTTEIVVFGRGGAVAIPPPAPKVSPEKGFPVGFNR